MDTSYKWFIELGCEHAALFTADNTSSYLQSTWNILRAHIQMAIGKPVCSEKTTSFDAYIRTVGIKMKSIFHWSYS